MNPQKKYILSTTAYGLTCMFGIITLTYFTIQKDWFLVFLSMLIIIVSLDNFFCGKHAQTCNKNIKTHYVLPWNVLKGKDL